MIDEDLYMECIIETFRVKFLKDYKERMMYVKSIYKAKMWGRKIDEENKKYLKMHGILNINMSKN